MFSALLTTLKGALVETSGPYPTPEAAYADYEVPEFLGFHDEASGHVVKVDGEDMLLHVLPFKAPHRRAANDAWAGQGYTGTHPIPALRRATGIRPGTLEHVPCGAGTRSALNGVDTYDALLANGPKEQEWGQRRFDPHYHDTMKPGEGIGFRSNHAGE